MWALVLLMAFIFVGCKKAPPPILKEIGPAKTKAGVAFNVQSDGGAAMWFVTENATETTAIYWGDTKLRTDFHNPKLLTAPVPQELYARPAKLQIYLLDTKTGSKSNSMTFTVE